MSDDGVAGGERAAAGPSNPEDVEVVREAFTMALYISLSLLAVMAAVPADILQERAAVALTVAFTAIGLVLAHQVAFRMSTRLVSHGDFSPIARRLLLAQLAGGAAVTLVAVLPIVVLGPDALPVSFFLLLGFVLLVGYRTARSVPVSRLRALLYVGGVFVAVLAVLIVKNLIGH